MINFIIPYKYHPERHELFTEVLKIMPRRNDIKISIIEMDSEEHLKHFPIIQYFRCKFEYCRFDFIRMERWDNIFHRALAINYEVKNFVSENDIICIYEADIIISHINEMIDDIKSLQWPTSGFNAIYRMNLQETNHYIKKNELPSFHRREGLGFSHANGHAGGITIISKKLFMEIKGIPEMMKGTWGNDDNLFWYKLNAFGYPFRNMGRLAYHLYHEHKTERDEEIRKQVPIIATWNKEDWIRYNETIKDDWGKNDS